MKLFACDNPFYSTTKGAKTFCSIIPQRIEQRPVGKKICSPNGTKRDIRWLTSLRYQISWWWWGRGIAIRAWINRVNRTFSLKRVRRFAYCDRTCFSNGAIIYEWRKKKGGRIYDVFAATVETVRFKELCPRSVNSMKINRS